VALPKTDAFTAANGTALTTYDSNYQNNSGALVINTNGVCPNAAGSECGVRWNGDTFDDDQYSQATLAAKPASDSFFIGVGVRHAAAGTASYYLYYTANTQTFFGKLVTGTFTQFGSTMGGRTVGEVLRIEAEGTTIRAKVDGAQQASQSDSALTTGAAGLTGYDTSTTLRLDDWEAGDIVPPANPTYVGSGAAVFTATSGATMAPQAPAGRASGDILVLVAHTSGSGDFTDAITNWTKLSSGTEANTAAQKVECWWRTADGTASDHATVGGIANTNVRGARIFAVHNAANQAPTVARSNNAASATVTFPSNTAAGTDSLSVLAYAYVTDPTAITQVSGYSVFDPDTTTLGNDMTLGTDAYRVNASSGSVTGGTATVSGGTFTNSVNVGLHFVFEAASSTRTLSGSGTVPVPAGSGAGLQYTSLSTVSGGGTLPTFSGSGTGLAVTNPSYTLSGGGTVPAPAGSGTGLTVAPPTYTLSGNGGVPVPSGSGAGLTFTAPVYTLSGGGTLPAFAGSGAGLQYTSLSTLSGSGTLAVPAGGGAGLQYTNPVYTLTGGATVPDLAGSGTGLAVTAPAYTLSGGGTLDVPAGGGAGLTFTGPAAGTFTLSGGGTVAVPSGSGSGLTFAAPVYTLSGGGTLDAPTGSGTGLTYRSLSALSGGATVPLVAGSGVGLSYRSLSTLSGGATVPELAGSGAGLTFTPRFTLSGGAAVPALAGGGAGLAVTNPAYTLSGSGALPGLTGGGAGLTYSDDVPIYPGTARTASRGRGMARLVAG
jgi:hypothetical protein